MLTLFLSEVLALILLGTHQYSFQIRYYIINSAPGEILNNFHLTERANIINSPLKKHRSDSALAIVKPLSLLRFIKKSDSAAGTIAFIFLL